MGGWMWGGTDSLESVATIRAALEMGVNLIDTAPVYALPTISSDSPKPYTGAVSMRLIPISNAARIVATDSSESVPPHIQPPIAQVPSPTRDARIGVPEIPTDSRLGL